MPKFLIVRFSSIGDIVLTSPVVRCLKQQVPNAEVHFLTKAAYSEVITHNPFIDKKFYLEEDLTKVISALEDEKYDFIIDLHKNLRSFRLKTILGVKSYSYNKLNFQKWLMVNFKINKLPARHIVDRYLDTVRKFGVVNDGKGLDYFVTAANAAAVQRLPPEFTNGYVAFVIGAKHNTKRLPQVKIANIISMMNQPVVLLGDNSDFENAEWIAEANTSTSTVYNACGKFSLNESAAIIKYSSSVISHDTGLMHIAAAFKKKIVSVWGNTIPRFGMSPYYGDFQISNYRAEIKNLYCRPCSKLGYEKCPQKHFRCMNEISEKEIISFIDNHSPVLSTL